MAFVLKSKTIKCPNCFYEGKAKVEETGCGLWLLLLVVLIVSFSFPPLFIVIPLMFLWLLLKPAKQICPRCKYPYPIFK
ncbi:MAG: LITAF-like zinc ribbon domain-containing protein [Candidatus Hydrogenedens sp.]